MVSITRGAHVVPSMCFAEPSDAAGREVGEEELAP